MSSKRIAKRTVEEVTAPVEVPSKEVKLAPTPIVPTTSTTTTPITPTVVPKYTSESLAKKTVNGLKEICREEGLKVGGNKTELLARLDLFLVNGVPTKGRSGGGGGSKMKTDTVVKRLIELGIPDNHNMCLVVGIRRGFVSLEGDDPLSNVVCTSSCCVCGERFPITINDCVTQTCYPGTDYEDGAESATFACPKCEERQYVTGLCQGHPSYDSGKGHNHCTKCPSGGQCIGDYRNSHCERCGKHYFQGMSGFGCSNCERGRGGGGYRGYGGYGGGRRKGDDCIIS
jgi:hypothetical protein